MHIHQRWAYLKYPRAQNPTKARKSFEKIFEEKIGNIFCSNFSDANGREL